MRKIILNIRVVGLICLMLMSACVSRIQVQERSPALTDDGAIRSEFRPGRLENSVAPMNPEAYRLGYGDVIEVKFSSHPEFNEQVSVRPDGRISLQEVGDIVVVGMTPMELDSLITLTYRRILQNPNVTVILRQFGGQQVYVLGEVERPGVYPLERNMTILRALTAAGGPKTSGNLKSVMVIRQNRRNKLGAVRVDLGLRALPHNLHKDIFVQANDVIYLPKTFIANINEFLSQVYDGILPPLDIYTRWRYWIK